MPPYAFNSTGGNLKSSPQTLAKSSMFVLSIFVAMGYSVNSYRVPDASTCHISWPLRSGRHADSSARSLPTVHAAQCRGIFFNWLKYILAHTEDPGHCDTNWLCGRFWGMTQNEDMCRPDTRTHALLHPSHLPSCEERGT